MIRLAAILALVAAPALAQDRVPSNCIALASVPGVTVIPAAWTDPVAADDVRLTYVGHSTFVLQTAGGLAAATDYAGYLGSADLVPDVVTMNNAHSSHYTNTPDPRIGHVLRGWGTDGAPAEIALDLGEMLVRNVTTDARGYGGLTRENQNSIFVFEVAGLCIGHLGHLHQEPSPQQYGAIGRLDVVMVPVDGTYTMDVVTMGRVVQRLRSSVVIPMHWFGGASLERFLDTMRGAWPVERTGANELTVSRHALPSQPTIVVLEPAGLR